MKNRIKPLLRNSLLLNSHPVSYVGYRYHIDRKPGFYLLKRSSDIIISLFVIIFVLSWLIPLVALCIRLESSGPVFFRQRRTGRGGKSFFCLKFRTMVLNKEADEMQARENDRRITRVGKILRKTNIDELPQFFNVLAGDMSIIGPRPHMLADCNLFSASISAYKLRNLVRPGITGLAQSKGFKGATDSYEAMLRRFQYDAYYVRNASFALDLSIIRQTLLQQFDFISKRKLARLANKNRELIPVEEMAA